MSVPAARPEVIRIKSASDIACAVPHLLGFVPTESLVAVALTGRRERISFTLRLDLPDDTCSAEGEELIADTIALRMAHAEAVSVLLFVFTDERPSGRVLPRESLVDLVGSGLPMPVRDAFLVVGDRLWSYLCADPRCCPEEGRPLDPGSSAALALAAAHALNGGAVLASRADVVRSVAPIGGVAAESMRQAMDRAMQAAAVAGRAGARTRPAARSLLATLTERYVDPPGTVTHDEAAQLALALHDVVFRDEVVRRLLEAEADPLQAVVTDVAHLAQPPLDAPIATLLAWVGYDRGDGVMADAALARALGSDPGYNLARLLRQALEGQVAPATLRGAWS